MSEAALWLPKSWYVPAQTNICKLKIHVCNDSIAPWPGVLPNIIWREIPPLGTSRSPCLLRHCQKTFINSSNQLPPPSIKCSHSHRLGRSLVLERPLPHTPSLSLWAYSADPCCRTCRARLGICESRSSQLALAKYPPLRWASRMCLITFC